MTAAEVKDALRRRHPATFAVSPAVEVPGAWTVIEEWHGIDVLALSAWKTPPNGKIGVSNPIIGYEVKVSRADYRRELRRPGKRAGAVAFTNAFYFAVPEGLLKPEEIAWEEPEWARESASWQRLPCRYGPGGEEYPGYGVSPGPCRRGKRWNRETGDERCLDCGGRGYREKSKVEREAPTLWVPGDVGLVVAREDGTARVARRSPVRPGSPRRIAMLGIEAPDALFDRRILAEFARWISVRPDPRHAACRRNGAMP